MREEFILRLSIPFTGKKILNAQVSERNILKSTHPARTFRTFGAFPSTQ